MRRNMQRDVDREERIESANVGMTVSSMIAEAMRGRTVSDLYPSEKNVTFTKRKEEREKAEKETKSGFEEGLRHDMDAMQSVQRLLRSTSSNRRDTKQDGGTRSTSKMSAMSSLLSEKELIGQLSALNRVRQREAEISEKRRDASPKPARHRRMKRTATKRISPKRRSIKRRPSPAHETTTATIPVAATKTAEDEKTSEIKELHRQHMKKKRDEEEKRRKRRMEMMATIERTQNRTRKSRRGSGATIPWWNVPLVFASRPPVRSETSKRERPEPSRSRRKQDRASVRDQSDAVGSPLNLADVQKRVHEWSRRKTFAQLLSTMHEILPRHCPKFPGREKRCRSFSDLKKWYREVLRLVHPDKLGKLRKNVVSVEPTKTEVLTAQHAVSVLMNATPRGT